MWKWLKYSSPLWSIVWSYTTILLSPIGELKGGSVYTKPNNLIHLSCMHTKPYSFIAYFSMQSTTTISVSWNVMSTEPNLVLTCKQFCVLFCNKKWKGRGYTWADDGSWKCGLLRIGWKWQYGRWQCLESKIGEQKLNFSDFTRNRFSQSDKPSQKS